MLGIVNDIRFAASTLVLRGIVDQMEVFLDQGQVDAAAPAPLDFLGGRRLEQERDRFLEVLPRLGCGIPWLATSTSGLRATYPSPSRSMIAVSSLLILMLRSSCRLR